MAAEAAADDGAAIPIEAIASSARLDDDVPAHFALDGADPLREFRARFLLPTPAASEVFERYIYFDGNSLGLQPKSAAAAVQVLARLSTLCGFSCCS